MNHLVALVGSITSSSSRSSRRYLKHHYFVDTLDMPYDESDAKLPRICQQYEYAYAYVCNCDCACVPACLPAWCGRCAPFVIRGTRTVINKKKKQNNNKNYEGELNCAKFFRLSLGFVRPSVSFVCLSACLAVCQRHQRRLNRILLKIRNET